MMPTKHERSNDRRAIATGETRERFRGCLLGGAVGDALGAPVEFMSRSEIVSRFGKPGIQDYILAYGRPGAITDDTQMTLFTAEAMLRSFLQSADRRSDSIEAVAAHAYLRWLRTQGERAAAYPGRSESEDGWLISNNELFARRAPGNTCLTALRSLARPPVIPAANDSKGCGGVMRIAPVGLFLSHEVRGDRGKLGRTFEIGMNLAGITHGHPSGYLTAGVLGVITALLVCGSPLMEAVAESRLLLVQYADHEETLRAIDRALELASTHPNSAAAIRKLGEGWVAEEALGIALYCALSAPTFKSGVVLAVNHDGDSDSTGAIAGNLLGCMHGAQAIPPKWLESLELREVINRLADDLASVWECKLDSPAREVYFSRYPPN